MKENKRAGFTIIETVLFLAISGLVILIGFVGIGGRTRNAQYNDSIRTVESNISRALSNVFSGVRTSPGSNRGCTAAVVGSGAAIEADPGTSDCVNMGVIIEFKNNGDDLDVINTYQITGRHLWGDQLDGVSDIDLIETSNPHINTLDVDTNLITWGTDFTSSSFSLDGVTQGTSNQAFGLIRSPGSETVFPVVLREEIDTTTALFTGSDVTEALIDQAAGARFCFEGVNGFFASVNFGGSFGNTASVDADDEICDLGP